MTSGSRFGERSRFSLVRRGNNFIVNVILTGGDGVPQQVQLLVDTGASYTVLDRDVALELGLDITQPLYHRQFALAHGATVAPIVKLQHLQIGSLVIASLDVAILTLPPGLGVDGLLGMDVYQRLGIRRLTLELDTATLVLRR